MTAADQLVPDPQVWKEFGVSPMTGWRWTKDPKLGFPPLIKINTRNYRSRAALDNFKIMRGYTRPPVIEMPSGEPPGPGIPAAVLRAARTLQKPRGDHIRPSIGWMEYAPGVIVRGFAVYKDVLLRSMAPVFYIGEGNHVRVGDFTRNAIHQAITRELVYGVDWVRYYIDSFTKSEARSREKELIDQYMPVANMVPGLIQESK